MSQIIKPPLKTPGVYINELPLQSQITEEESAVPAFIGYTEKAMEHIAGDLHLVAKKISSMAEYEQLYGRSGGIQFNKVTLDAKNNVINSEIAKPNFLLYYSLRLYFSNGGGSCYIVSIGNYGTALQKADFMQGLDIIKKENGPTLLLFPEAVNLPGNDLYEIQQKSLQQAEELADRFCILDLKFANTKLLHDAVVNEFRNNIGLAHLKYGAAYSPFLKANTELHIPFKNWKDIIWKNGEKINLKDLTGDPAIQQKITELESAIAANDVAVMKQEAELLNLFPVMKTIAFQLNQTPLTLPPSPAIAGKYCEVDETRGVWKAPANVSLVNVNELAYTIRDNEQDDLNIDVNAGKSINAIRKFTGRGFLIWGARTLAGNDNEWRYIPVRRFANLVQESVKKSIMWAVFEPNNAVTWTKLRAEIDNYLMSKWREGALQGAKPDQAFFVKVGLGQTMTAQDIQDGNLIVEIGMSAVRPAEFIILRFSIKCQAG